MKCMHCEKTIETKVFVQLRVVWKPSSDAVFSTEIGLCSFACVIGYCSAKLLSGEKISVSLESPA